MKKRYALSVPFDAFTLAEHPEIAREAERLGYSDAWTHEVDGCDCFSPLAVVAGATSMRVGTAIANVFTRGPATLAQSAAGLAEIAPGRFQLGIGSGSSTIVETWNGGRFVRPATRVREMAQVLRRLLAGERVTLEGQTVNITGFRLSRPPSQPVPIHIAGLRPGMLRVAGELGDGAILNWLAATDVPKSVAVVREAAAAAGRNAESVEISARLMVNIDPPGEAGDQAARRHINAYLNVPVYKEFHRWLGRAGALQPMWDAWDAGDRRGAVAALAPSTVDEVIVRGAPSERNAHVRRYLEAGVDTVFLQFFTAEQDEEKKRALILQAMRDMAPGPA